MKNKKSKDFLLYFYITLYQLIMLHVEFEWKKITGAIFVGDTADIDMKYPPLKTYM